MRKAFVFAALLGTATAAAGAAEIYVGPTAGVAATGGLSRVDYGALHDADGVWLPLVGGARADVRFSAYDVKAEAIVLWPFKGVYHPPDAWFYERASEFGVAASGGRRFGAGPVSFKLALHGRWVYADVDYRDYPHNSYRVNDVFAGPACGLVCDAPLLRFNYTVGVGYAGVYQNGRYGETDRFLTIIWEADAGFKLSPSLTLNADLLFLRDTFGFDRGWAQRTRLLISGGPSFALGG
jgi:hypothetical protein